MSSTASTRKVRRGMPGVFTGALGRALGGRRRVEGRQLDSAVAVGGPHDGEVGSDAVQADELVHPFTLDGGLALQFQTQFDEERDSGREILDHNPDVIHPVDHHFSP